jgi:ATP adenylyltransferase
MIHYIVPHWDENTNFMPLFTEARVMPEHLRATYRKLRARFHQLSAASGKRHKKRTGR